jgi:hypothetical protein
MSGSSNFISLPVKQLGIKKKLRNKEEILPLVIPTDGIV